MTHRIRALIADDEPIAREGIRMHLERSPDIEIIGECSTGLETVSAILESSPDLVFLDVQMPELDGFGALNLLFGEKIPAVIFVTAYDEYALRAFDAHAIDYILKPVDGDRFDRALQRARILLQKSASEEMNRRLAALLGEFKESAKYLDRLAIKSSGRIYFVSVEEIDWIEAADNYAQLHAAGETHLIHSTMSGLETKLDPKIFLRMHRSAIVNIDRIKELRPLFHGEYEVVLKDGTKLTSGRSYRDRLQSLLDN